LAVPRLLLLLQSHLKKKKTKPPPWYDFSDLNADVLVNKPKTRRNWKASKKKKSRHRNDVDCATYGSISGRELEVYAPRKALSMEISSSRCARHPRWRCKRF
jgi:hypothetical protein